jgi:hypothetical protein
VDNSLSASVWLSGLHPVPKTPIGVFMGLEVGHGETKVYTGVQA